MTSSSVRPSEVIGRESDKEKIVNVPMQKDDNNVIYVIPIVGIGDLRKDCAGQVAVQRWSYS